MLALASICNKQGCDGPACTHVVLHTQHRVYYFYYNIPSTLSFIWSSGLHTELGALLAFEKAISPLAISAQAALAPHQTTDQEESADSW
jgi:hypothetical protein